MPAEGQREREREIEPFWLKSPAALVVLAAGAPGRPVTSVEGSLCWGRRWTSPGGEACASRAAVSQPRGLTNPTRKGPVSSCLQPAPHTSLCRAFALRPPLAAWSTYFA